MIPIKFLDKGSWVISPSFVWEYEIGLLGGGNSTIFGIFTPILGEMIQFDEHILQMGWFDHQLVGL